MQYALAVRDRTFANSVYHDRVWFARHVLPGIRSPAGPSPRRRRCCGSTPTSLCRRRPPPCSRPRLRLVDSRLPFIDARPHLLDSSLRLVLVAVVGVVDLRLRIVDGRLRVLDPRLLVLDPHLGCMCQLGGDEADHQDVFTDSPEHAGASTLSVKVPRDGSFYSGCTSMVETDTLRDRFDNVVCTVFYYHPSIVPLIQSVFVLRPVPDRY